MRKNLSDSSTNSRNSIACAYAFRILRDFTDAEHTMSQKEISDMMEEKYNVVISRKAVSRMLHTLEDGDLGICCRDRRFYMSGREKGIGA